MRTSPLNQASPSCRGCASPDRRQLLALPGFPRAAQHFLQRVEQKDQDQPVTLQLLECQDCGLVQLGNEPVDYYRDVITAAALSAQSREILLQEWRPLLETFKIAGARALEVGAGKGDFLAVLDQLGFDATGIENSAENVAIGRSRGYRLHQGYIMDVDWRETFDLIVCNNFLEHQPDIKGFLGSVKHRLAEGGVVYFSVPNLDYLLQRSCLYEFVADHLVYFNRQTLRATFESNGFAVEHQYEKNNRNDLVVVARRAPRLNLNQHLSTMRGVVDSLRALLVAAQGAGQRVVTWGAGHRALALLALADARSIDFIVDSAPFKQNLLAPLTHRPIRSPDHLFEHGCDLLILMLPGSYANQVKEDPRIKQMNCTTLVFEDIELDGETIKGVSNGSH